MPRKTLKSLEEQVKNLRELRAGDRLHIERLTAENKMHVDRIKQIAGENESLLADKRWLKCLIQNLTGDKNAITR